MAIYISGSIAYDRIMTFPGYFKDHILPEKLHILNVSFMVERMEEQRGGCAGNIAYSLALLGEKPLILSCVGRDFKHYADALTALGLPLNGLRSCDDLFTALCYITTDLQSNQITGFYPGAMTRPCGYTYPAIDPARDIAIVSPGNVDDMRDLPRFYREKGVPYIYDPGQQLPVLKADELLDGISGSFALTTNDYELDMICKATGCTRAEIQARTQWCVTTYGEKGCSVTHTAGIRTDIPAVPPTALVDPTGAGDAHRAGILKGLVAGLAMPEAAKIGAACASFAIAQYGTQIHTFDTAAFIQRYEGTFGPLPVGLTL